MWIKNANVYINEHKFEKKDIEITGDRITRVINSDSGTEYTGIDRNNFYDAEGLKMIPGLIDLHFHGAVGYDFCDADNDGLEKIATYEQMHGIAAICPATMSYSEDILSEIMESAANYKKTKRKGADFVGINMEGPFISLNKAGAQNPKYIIEPDITMFRRLQTKSRGLIKLVDIAPELDGAEEFIEVLKNDVNISIAHTDADYETSARAYEKGARHLTHTFNAMPTIWHRSPGPIIAAYDHHAEIELIADGIHNHAALIRFVFQTFDKEKIILISDSMRATGMPDGEYTLGGQKVAVEGSKAVLTERPDIIAGSVTNLYDCMRKAILQMQVPPEDAIRAATENPAKAIGLFADYGSIEAGKKADFLLVNNQYEIIQIYFDGRRIK